MFTTFAHCFCVKVCLIYTPGFSAVSRLLSVSYTSLPGRPVHSDTNSTSLASILATKQLRAKHYSLTFPPPSIARYSFIQLSELGHGGGNEMTKLGHGGGNEMTKLGHGGGNEMTKLGHGGGNEMTKLGHGGGNEMTKLGHGGGNEMTKLGHGGGNEMTKLGHGGGN